MSGKALVAKLKKLDFDVIRIRGSHYRMKHKDGRITTVPVHSNKDLPKGLIRKIIQQDIQMTLEEFWKI